MTAENKSDQADKAVVSEAELDAAADMAFGPMPGVPVAEVAESVDTKVVEDLKLLDLAADAAFGPIQGS